MTEQYIKPECDLGNLDGPEGNVFCVIGRVCKALKRAGYSDKATEFQNKATSGDYSYEDILDNLVPEYVEEV